MEKSIKCALQYIKIIYFDPISFIQKNVVKDIVNGTILLHTSNVVFAEDRP